MDSGGIFQKQKQKLYVGYDHYADGSYFEGLRRLYTSIYDMVRDNSLERELDSEDAEGFIRRTGEEAMAGCAGVVILCGGNTHTGKFVDWEIKAALDRKLSLIGIVLPTDPIDPEGKPLLPPRLQVNLDGGFAVICRWQEISSTQVDLGARLRFAMAQPPERIDNSLPIRLRNG